MPDRQLHESLCSPGHRSAVVLVTIGSLATESFGCGEVGGGVLPGFEPHFDSSLVHAVHCSVPGFGAQAYRDFGHGSRSAHRRRRTGISGTDVPGMGAHKHREVSHAGTGKWGTTPPRRTGNWGTVRPPKSSRRHAIPDRNFDLINWSNNTTTQGGSFSNEEPCPRKA